MVSAQGSLKYGSDPAICERASSFRLRPKTGTRFGGIAFALGGHHCIMHLVKLQSGLTRPSTTAVFTPVTSPVELGK